MQFVHSDKIEKRRSLSERLFFCSNLKIEISLLFGIIVHTDNLIGLHNIFYISYKSCFL